jgi:hypothetical protein
MKRRTISIKPCLKVTIKISVNRAVKYNQTNFSAEENGDGSEDATWTGHRRYKDKNEAKEADRIFSKARQRLLSIGTHTALGFVVPLEDEAKLDAALVDAEAMVDDANQRFRYCHITLDYDVVEYTDATRGASKSIAAKLDESTQKIQEALRDFKPANAKKVLNTTKNVIDTLADPATKKALAEAREQARDLATEIQIVIKQFDGNVQNAMQSKDGKELMVRASAKWNF